jgi:hypothetical protein
VIKLALIIGIVLAFYAPFGNTLSAKADCKSKCRDQYESRVKSCTSFYADPEYSDSLEICIDRAKDEYDDCIEECESRR